MRSGVQYKCATSAFLYEKNANPLLLDDVMLVIDATGTSYTYDPDNDRLLTVSQDESDVAYSYNGKGQLTGIDGETSDYTLTYDAFGNVKTVKVGTTTLVTHTYGANNGNLLSSAYGNGFTVEYVYDSLDRVTKVKWNYPIRICLQRHGAAGGVHRSRK